MSTNLAVELKKNDLDKVEQEAKQVIQKVANTDNLQLDELMDQIGRMGQRTMEKAGQSLEMLQRPVGDMVSGKRSDVSNNILRLRSEIDSLSKSKQLGLFDKIMRKTPLKNYIYKYQSVKTNVDAIVLSLRNGKDTLEENMVYMRNLKRTAIEEVYNLQMRIAMGNQLKTLFEEEIGKPENAGRKTTLERGLRKVVTRIQSFTEMIMLYQQAIAGADIINDNNDKLIDSVDATIDKTQHLITVSAMIALALQDQMETIEAVNTANQTLQNMFEENSRMLKETTQKTNELLGKPAMQLEAVERAMGDLFSAMDLYEQSNRSIIKSATEQTGRMTEINKQMNDRLGLMQSGGADAQPTRIEAQKESQQLQSISNLLE
ncbi:toxic anion resistance protein [Saccharibacillus sp. CPCC 101409]|uniref:toxic anion resistance protein n=1 Tax=Saccharibacillus sp. CPCC 101409 TaxID=3058041 RepID=UPI0026720E2C|nr:toxic anion resistance protein [Saccharibacillus sp. CPCC 101409]MDO3408529.1 toxic anion resistance protein [Saccharibacillus sp. CPCC 101409]